MILLSTHKEWRKERLCYLTCGFWRKSEMSFGQQGHFMTFFCARRVRPPLLLCLTWVIPANLPVRHSLQKLWAQGVVTGELMTSRQIWQPNSELNKKKTAQMCPCRLTLHTFYLQTLHRPLRNLSLLFPAPFLALFLSAGSKAAIAFLLAGGDFIHFQRPSASC